MIRKMFSTLALAVLPAVTGLAQAARVVTPEGTVKDTATGITWTQSNFMDALVGYEFRSDLPTAQLFIQDLNNMIYVGRSDWILPSVDDMKGVWEGALGNTPFSFAPAFNEEVLSVNVGPFQGMAI